MSKITKGALVYRFKNWNGAGVFCVTRCTVESWGAKQGTISFLADGKMAEERIYTGALSNGYTDAPQFVLVSECADPIAEGTARAAAWVAAELEAYRGYVGHPAKHQPSVLETIAKLETATPTCKTRAALYAELAAK